MLPFRLIRKTGGTGLGNFESSVVALLSSLPETRRIASLVFYAGIADSSLYDSRLNKLKEILTRRYGANQPALTLVAQQPVGFGLALESCLLPDDPDYTINYQNIAGLHYVIAQQATERMLFIGGVQSHSGPEVFDRIQQILIRERMPVDSVIRQWNYIEDITGRSSGIENYQLFNRARSAFYEGGSWPDGYPAATGIGTTAGGVLVRLEALVSADPTLRHIRLGNELQIDPYRYSGTVLDASGDSSCTPKFERARIVCGTDAALIYLSGTAAIRGEASVSAGDATAQAQLTLENIAHLLARHRLTGAGCSCAPDPKYHPFIVYLKDEQDYPAVSRVLQSMRPELSPLYLVAGLCRPELLVEMEAVGLARISEMDPTTASTTNGR